MIKKITDIQIQKKNKKRCSIFLNDEYDFSLSLDILYEFNLKIGMEIDEEFYNEILVREELKKAFNSTLNSLSRSPKTKKQMSDKLKKAGYDNFIIEKTLEKLVEFSYLDDRQYAKEYVNSKIKKDGFYKIKMQLIKLGINKYIIDELSENWDREKEKETAKMLILKKIKSIEKMDLKVKMKLSKYLESKGFSYEIIKSTLSEFDFKDYDDYC